ncbi:TPA: hypothetical protein DDW35_00470 [Candidatus Sumerlaeota bacterium]|nr:hypothetical protein [Candidatus Sumerlaeota bacterium]
MQDDKTVHILLVEDNPADAHLVRLALADAILHCEIDCADHLQTACEMLGKKEYDVALLDLSLPDSTGVETVRRFHAVAARLPFLVLTGLKNQELALEVLQAGAMDCLAKEEMVTAALERAIRYAIERRRLWAELEAHALALEAGERNLRNIISASLDAIMIVDMEGITRFVNPAAEALLGRSPESLLDQTFEFSLKVHGTAEVNILRGAGEYIVAEMRVTHVEWKGLPAYCATFRDITDRKQVEEALRRSDRRHRRITEAMTDYIVTVRVSNGKAVETIHSANCIAVTGYSRDDFEKDPYLWLNMVPLEDHPAVLKQAEQALSGQPAAPVVHRIIRKDGALRWVRSTAVGHRDEDGIATTSYDSLIRDITEAHQAEEDLRKAKEDLEVRVQERTAELRKVNQSLEQEIGEHKATEEVLRGYKESLESLHVAMQDGLVGMNANGVHVDLNPAFCRMTGFARREILGSSMPCCYWPPESREVFETAFERARAGDLDALEISLMRKSGERFPVLMSPSWIRRNQGGLEYYMATFKDITQRKRIEEELRQRTAELQERNFELDAFGHTVAHDLKTPLSNVLTSASIVDKKLDTLDTGKIRELLHIIIRNGHKSVSIIDELLLLAEVRMAEVEIGPLHMAGIVDEVLLRLTGLIESTQTEIVLPHTWPVAIGYAPWVEELWVNYISNGIRYGGKPPYIELGATEQKGNMIRYWTRDHGPGISPEKAERLFAPFVRVTELKTQGHGLGLSIVKRIAQKLGGEVGVESEVGKGSVFYFTLPREM